MTYLNAVLVVSWTTLPFYAFIMLIILKNRSQEPYSSPFFKLCLWLGLSDCVFLVAEQLRYFVHHYDDSLVRGTFCYNFLLVCQASLVIHRVKCTRYYTSNTVLVTNGNREPIAYTRLFCFCFQNGCMSNCL